MVEQIVSAALSLLRPLVGDFVDEFIDPLGDMIRESIQLAMTPQNHPKRQVIEGNIEILEQTCRLRLAKILIRLSVPSAEEIAGGIVGVVLAAATGTQPKEG